MHSLRANHHTLPNGRIGAVPPWLESDRQVFRSGILQNRASEVTDKLPLFFDMSFGTAVWRVFSRKSCVRTNSNIEVEFKDFTK